MVQSKKIQSTKIQTIQSEKGQDPANSAADQLPTLGPLTRKIAGIAQLPPGVDYRKVFEDALLEKYGLDK